MKARMDNPAMDESRVGEAPRMYGKGGASPILVSDAARYITGQVLVVDGGALAW